MMGIKIYANKYGYPHDNNFAAACFADNSIGELEEALTGPADKTDCKTWGIDKIEWREAITAALNEKKNYEN